MSRKRKRNVPLATTFSINRTQVQAGGHVMVERLQGMKVIRETAHIQVPKVLRAAPRDFQGIKELLGNGDDISDLQDSQEVIEHYIQQPGHKRKTKHQRDPNKFVSVVHDKVLKDWVEKGEREVYLTEMLRLEGWRGSERARCMSCPTTRLNEPSVRCKDCWGNEVLCVDCCVQRHQQHPLHRVERWNGDFFENVALQDLGLIVQIGHSPGETCTNPAPAPRSFLIIHTNGFHPVTLHFCHCNMVHRAGNRTQQLLRAELFPSSMYDPATCCTFEALGQFHLLTLQSKVTAYDYYKTLEKSTNNTGLGKHYDRFRPWLRMVRQWRHLKMLKRAGRGHYEDGIRTTKEGELAVKCPACPDPKVNLPDNWETISDDLKYIYTTVIAIDANFRLRRRAVSNDARDPALGSGWAYFVEDTASPFGVGMMHHTS